MGMIHQLEKWSITHHPKWLVFLRAALGLALFLKGISFMNDMVAVRSLLTEDYIFNVQDWLILTITWVHLLGGFLIIIGLFTRWAVVFQIPILLGAILFINAPKGFFAPDSELIFSILVLLLLVLFLFEGGGPLSLDNYFKKNPK